MTSHNAFSFLKIRILNIEVKIAQFMMFPIYPRFLFSSSVMLIIFNLINLNLLKTTILLKNIKRVSYGNKYFNHYFKIFYSEHMYNLIHKSREKLEERRKKNEKIYYT